MHAAAKQRQHGNEALLAFVRGLATREDLANALNATAVLDGIISRLWVEVKTLQQAGAATATELQSKFAGAIELQYAGLDTFFGGLEGLIGAPNPKLEEGMAEEHLSGPATESIDTFVTGNYGVETCSKVEWLFVVDAEATPDSAGLARWPEEAEAKLPDRSRCRQRRPLSEVETAAEARNALLVGQG